ncbi:MAG: hypothetical protein M1401_01745 [Chloroflexi bacterium]|nr:hypothetical protein [Chloroflexota bacterium]
MARVRFGYADGTSRDYLVRVWGRQFFGLFGWQHADIDDLVEPAARIIPEGESSGRLRLGEPVLLATAESLASEPPRWAATQVWSSSWSPAGDAVLVGLDRAGAAVGSCPEQLWYLGLAEGVDRPLADGVCEPPQWTPDGGAILYRDRASSTMVLVDRAGRSLQTLPWEDDYAWTWITPAVDGFLFFRDGGLWRLPYGARPQVAGDYLGAVPQPQAGQWFFSPQPPPLDPQGHIS